MNLGVAAAWGQLVLFAETPPPPEMPPELAWWPWIWALSSLVWLLGLVGWIWMLVHCYQHEPDREFWFWVMIFIPPAAFVYFFARWLPSRGGGRATMPKGLKRWSRGREIQQLEIAAQQIGNPHQWIQLGDALRDVGRYADAAEAYDKALAKEADSLPALWGAGIARTLTKSLILPASIWKKAWRSIPNTSSGTCRLPMDGCFVKWGKSTARRSISSSTSAAGGTRKPCTCSPPSNSNGATRPKPRAICRVCCSTSTAARKPSPANTAAGKAEPANCLNNCPLIACFVWLTNADPRCDNTCCNCNRPRNCLKKKDRV